MRNILIVALVVASLIPMQRATASGWNPSTTITGYFFYGSGGLLYLKTAVTSNPDACASTAYSLVDISAMTRFKEFYAAVLSAIAANQQISLLLDGCLSGYPKVNGFAYPNVW